MTSSFLDSQPMKSKSPLQFMFMPRYLMSLGTSVIFVLTSSIVTTAQTSLSRPISPWGKMSRDIQPKTEGIEFKAETAQTVEKASQTDSPFQHPLESSPVTFESQAEPSFKSTTRPPQSKSVALFNTLRHSKSTLPSKPIIQAQESAQASPSSTPTNNPFDTNNTTFPAPTTPSTSPFTAPDPLQQQNQAPAFPANGGDTRLLPANPAPNELNSSGNPLIFPTKPQEVDTTIRQAVTLNQAIELALRNNKDLQAARITLERSQAELEAARSALFPTLSTEFQFSRDNSAGAELQNAIAEQNAANSPFPITPNVTPESTTNANGSLQLGYNIFSGGERAASIRRSEIQVQNSRLQVEVVSEQTRFEATDRYYALQGTDAQVAIAQASVEDAAQSLRDARLLEQAGLGTRFDVLRAEGDLATANEALTRAISDQRTARRRLAQILSVGQKVELTAADPITEAGRWNTTLEQSIVQAYKNRAELEQQLNQADIYEQERYIALAGIQPRVDFLANYNYQNNFNNSVGLVDGYSFAARVRWTFFDGGRAFAEARRADRNMDLAQTEFARQRNQIRLDVEEAYYTLISTQENIDSTRTNVTRFEEALRLARLRFQAGVGTQTDVINAQRDLANARGRYLQAIIGYNQSLNRLQRAVSNLPTNNLFEVR